jgi:hypothetical protein
MEGVEMLRISSFESASLEAAAAICRTGGRSLYWRTFSRSTGQYLLYVSVGDNHLAQSLAQLIRQQVPGVFVIQNWPRGEG